MQKRSFPMGTLIRIGEKFFRAIFKKPKIAQKPSTVPSLCRHCGKRIFWLDVSYMAKFVKLANPGKYGEWLHASRKEPDYWCRACTPNSGLFAEPLPPGILWVGDEQPHPLPFVPVCCRCGNAIGRDIGGGWFHLRLGTFIACEGACPLPDGVLEVREEEVAC